MNEDLQFRPGTTHAVVIDTNQYSGNFERELGAAATGVYDTERYHGEKEAAAFQQRAAEEGWQDVAERLQRKSHSVIHEEYGPIRVTIWSTPDRHNDGYGGHADGAPGPGTYPAYESVAIFFREPLTEEEIARITTEVARWRETQRPELVIRAIRQQRITVSVSTEIA